MGGIITALTSGLETTSYLVEDVDEDIDEGMQEDIRHGLYTEDEFYYLVDVVSGEADTYEGMIAVAYEVLNRCRINNKSIDEVVTPKVYTGFDKNRLRIVPEDGIAKKAVLAVLRGEADNPIGNIQNHFGRINGYDIWFEPDKCASVIVIGEGSLRNVFFESPGSVHNKQTTKTDNAVLIYDNEKGEWLCEEYTNENIE